MNHFIQPLEPRRLFDAGELDPSFGDAGHTELSIPGDHKLLQIDFDSAGDGKVIVTAVSFDNDQLPAAATVHLWRLRPDGSRDTSFGLAGDGEVTFDIPPDYFASDSTVFQPPDITTTVHTDGSLLLQVGNLLYRYKSNGRLDRSFAKRGRAIAHAFAPREAQAATIDQQGRLYVVGGDSNRRLTIVRLATNGKPDLSFDPAGARSFDAVTSLPGGNRLAIATLGDGSVMLNAIVEGTGVSDSEFFSPAYDKLVLKFNPSGELDADYADAGIFRKQEFQVDIQSIFTSDPIITPDGWAFHTIHVDNTGSIELAVRAVNASGSEGFLEHPGFNALALVHDDSLMASITYFEEFFDVHSVTFRDRQGNPIEAATTASRAVFANDWAAARLAIATDGALLVLSRSGEDSEKALAVHRLYRDDAPAAQLTAKTLAVSQTMSYRFQVEYRDNDGLNLSTLGNDDLTVLTPSGNRRRARLISADASADAKLVNATYAITSEDGVWDSLDNGQYAVRLERRSVRDIHGNVIPQRPLGSFTVAIAPPIVPITAG